MTIPGHLLTMQQPGLVELESSGALGAGLDDLSQLELPVPPPSSVIGSGNRAPKAISICQSPAHGDWFGEGPISSKLSDFCFNLGMWAKLPEPQPGVIL